MIDVNDPPVFDKVTTEIYEREEDEPGRVVYKPKVTDEDSDPNNIRCVTLLSDSFSLQDENSKDVFLNVSIKHRPRGPMFWGQ